MVGQSGEGFARLAIESDGSLLFGDGTGPFDTQLRRAIARKVHWDPPPIEPSKHALTMVRPDHPHRTFDQLARHTYSYLRSYPVRQAVGLATVPYIAIQLSRVRVRVRVRVTVGGGAGSAAR